MTPHDKEQVEEILAGNGTHFTAQLLRLIRKADTSNRAKLHEVFPEEVNLVHIHQHGLPFYNDKNNGK